jgi:CTP:molybdopterin cytidylyltransferase MocA
MRAMILRPWVVVLAAGGSRRFGSPKLLACIGGETLLNRAVRAALGARPAGCVVVLGARADELGRRLRAWPVRVVINRRWRSGLASSLRAGVSALPRQAPAALVLLADQAMVGPAELELLLAAWRRTPRRIVASRAGDFLGPPAVFPRRVFRDLRRLRGDAGARTLLSDPRRAVSGVELPRAAHDVDRPGDLRRLRRSRVQS